jgi:hypothetical protein
MTKAFLTGSRVYGQPTPESDVDLVVFISEEDKEILSKLADTILPIRFGKLNVIALTNEDAFDAWKAATKKVKHHMLLNNDSKPLDKKDACLLFEAELASCGWPYNYQSTPTPEQKEEIQAYKDDLNEKALGFNRRKW